VFYQIRSQWLKILGSETALFTSIAVKVEIIRFNFYDDKYKIRSQPVFATYIQNRVCDPHVAADRILHAKHSTIRAIAVIAMRRST